MLRRCLSVLLSLALLAPSLASAQQTKAGVITTLEGNVTARRVALPDPVPLKFKDDVFLQDTVTTGEKSLARMLLGGKAVVTVRERSILTITEVPGRSTIELESGKFAMAVAREKLRPGEELVIRTPNAIAGVRGTVVVTEVERQGAQVSGVPAVVTNFYVLRGEITAQRLDLATKQPFGTPFQVGTFQAYSGAGAALPRVVPVPREQLGQITAGLQPSGPKGGGDAGKEQVKSQAVQTAVGLLATLQGGPGLAPRAHAPVAPLAHRPHAPLIPPVGKEKDADAIKELSAQIAALLALIQKFLGDVVLTTAAKRFTGTVTSTTTAPVIELTNANVVQFGSDVSFVEVLNAANVTLAGPLLKSVNSRLTTTGKLLAIQGGTLKSTSVSPLITLESSFITTADALIAMNGGSLILAGPLLLDTNGTILTGQELARLQNGATITSTGTGALVQLNGTTVGGSAALNMTNSTITLAGPLVSLTNIKPTDFSGPGPEAPLFRLSGSTITSTGSGALLALASTDADPDSNFLRLVNGSRISLAGPLLSATGGRLGSGQPSSHAAFLIALEGSRISSTTTSPLLSMSGVTFMTNGDLVAVAGNGSTIDLRGPLLNFGGGSTMTLSRALAAVSNGGQIVESHPTSPFASITGGTHSIAFSSGESLLQLFGRSTALASETIDTPGLQTLTSTLTLGTDQPLQRNGSGAFLELSGATVNTHKALALDDALLSASAPLLSLRNNASMTVAADAVNLTGRAKLTTTAPLVKLDASTLTIASGHALRILNGSFLNVVGDLFSLANGSRLTISNGGAILIKDSVVKISGFLIAFGGSGGNLFSIFNTLNPSVVINGLPVLLVNGATSLNVSVSNEFIRNPGLGTFQIPVVGGTSAVILDGPNAKLIISGN